MSIEALRKDMRRRFGSLIEFPLDEAQPPLATEVLEAFVHAIIDEHLVALTSKTETATREGGDPDRPAAETARTNIAPPARSGDEPPVPAISVTGMHVCYECSTPLMGAYCPQCDPRVPLSPAREAAIRGLMDALQDARSTLFGQFGAEYDGIDNALAAARSAGIEGCASDG